METVLYQYRWQDTHPQTVTSGQWYPWQDCDKNKYNEIKMYIAEGYQYQVRELVVKPEEKDIDSLINQVWEFGYPAYLPHLKKFLALYDAGNNDALKNAIVEKAIIWALCPEQGAYKNGPSVEDVCEDLSEAVTALVGEMSLRGKWRSLEDIQEILDAHKR